MNFTLLTRIDKFITLTLIVLGFSVFSPFSNYFLFGVIVAILSVLQLVYHFGQEAGASKEQMKQYKQLMVEAPALNDSELKDRYIKVQNSDNNPWRSLEAAAYLRACSYYSLPAEYNLTFVQMFWSWIAGDLPSAKEFTEKRHEETCK